MGEERRTRRLAGRIALLGAGCVLLAFLLVLLAHTAPVRRVVLRQVVATLADRLDIAFRADALGYDVLARRVTLAGVAVAALESPQDPFLTADLVEITIPTAAFFGTFSIDRVRLENAHLNIRRRADGTTNLPPGGSAGLGEPDAIPLDRLDTRQLAVTLTDEAEGLSLVLPAVALDIGRTAGELRLIQPGRLDRRGLMTAIDALGGGIVFDGRALQLTRFVVTTPDAHLTLDGRMALLTGEPSADLRFTGRGDLRAVARWVTDAALPAGALAIEGTLAGALAAPAATVRIQSDAIAWPSLVLTDVDAALEANANAIAFSRVEANVAGGRLTAAGDVALPGGDVDLTASWANLDLETLARALDAAGTVRPSGKVAGSATIRGAGGDIAAWTIDARATSAAPPRAGGRLPIAGASELHVAAGRWRLNAEHVIDDTPVRAELRGVLVPQALASSTVEGTIAVDETDLVRLMDSLRAANIVEIPQDAITGGRVRADVVLTGTLARPHIEMTAGGRALAAGGIRDLTADVTADGTLQEMAVTARVRQGAGNEAAATGTLFLEDDRLEAHVTARLDAPGALRPGLPVGGVIDVELDASGRFSAIGARGNVTVADATYDQIRVGRIVATIDADADIARVDVALSELGTRAHANVALSGTRTATVDLEVEEANLARLVRDVDLPAPLRGTLSLTAHGEAMLDDWRRGTATVDVTRFDASVGELPLRLAAPGRATYGNQTISVESLEAELGGVRLSIAGRLPVDEGAAVVAPADALRALLVGDVADAIAAGRAAGLERMPEISGRGLLAVVARVTGSAAQPELAADLDLADGELAYGNHPPARAVTLRAHVAEGWIEPLTLSAEWQQSRVSAEARVPLSLLRDYLPAAAVAAPVGTPDHATIAARAEAITPSVLAPFVEPGTLAQIGGAIDASLQFDAASLDLQVLRGEVRLDRLDIRIAGLPIAQREPTRIVVEDGVARVAAWDWAGQGATLAVQGQVQLANREAAILSAGRFDLRLLTPFVRDAGITLSGTLAPRVAVVGPLGSPRIDGEVALDAGEIRLRDPRVIATGVTAFAVLSPQQARITSLTGVVNGGALTGTGELRYGGVDPVSARVAGTIAGMGLELPEGLRSELNVDAAVEVADGPAGASGSVMGTVTILRSAYREQLAVVTGLLGTLRAERLAAASDADSLADRMTLDVRVVTDADIVVDNNLARLELGGDLRVIGTAAAPALSGRATLREGGQLYLGRNVYTIESGTIDFANPTTVEPDLNVQGTTSAGGHEIELTLSGTPDTLEVDLRSLTDPGLDQANVTSLLLTGRPLDEISGAEAQIVGEQVLGYLSGDVLGIAGRAVGLDTIRLGGAESTLRRDPAAIAAQTDPTSRLTFGKTIGNDLEIIYSQSLRHGGAQTWVVDYEPIPRVDLRLVQRDDNLRSYEFRHDVSLGSATDRPRTLDRPRRELEVTEVSMTGDTGVPVVQLRQALRLEAGDRFDFSEWQRDRDRLEEVLHRAGRLEARVTAQRSERDSGVALSYDVQAGPPTAIAVTGYDLSRDARDSLETAWSQTVFDDFLREEAAEIVRRALTDDGYLEPAVSADITTNGTKTLRLIVEPGTRTSERRVDIEAADEALAEGLEQWVRDRGLDRTWRAPEELEQALAIELRGRGYLTAEVAAGVPRVEGLTAVLTVTVDAGRPFTIGSVHFDGREQIGVDRVRDAAALAPGMAYAPVDVDAARERVQTLYRRDGFSAASVTVEPMVDAADPQVSLVFTIDEGPRQVLREVLVRGNRAIDTDVVTRALDLEIGEPLGADAWLQARARLFDTALFRRVDVTAEPIEDATIAGERPVRVVVTVEEWPALRLRYGFQLSEERPEGEIEGRDLTPGLSADVTRRTLFGRAVTVGAAAEYQRRERLARVFMSAPTMAGWPVESLLTAQRSRRDFADAAFVTDLSGISWEQRVRPTPSLRLSYSYRFDRDHTFQTEPDPFLPLDETVTVARLTGSTVFDTRDDPYDARRGLLLSSNLEFAPESLGSQFRFLSHLGQAYHFHPWRGVVFASAARVGLVAPLGGQELLPSERFFAGGARTVRGVAEEGLGPRDFFGDPAGGRALIVLNQEARFPIYRWVRGVGFIDTGNVFETPGDIDLRSFVTSIGAGVRITTPFALLRADFAHVLSAQPDARIVRWTFGIGHTF